MRFLIDVTTYLRCALNIWVTINNKNRILSKHIKYFNELGAQARASNSSSRYYIIMHKGHSFRINPPLQGSCLLGTIIILLLKKGSIILPIVLKYFYILILKIVPLMSTLLYNTLLFICKILCIDIYVLCIALYIFRKSFSNPKIFQFFF